MSIKAIQNFMNIKGTKEQKPSLHVQSWSFNIPSFVFLQILAFKIRIGVFLSSNLLHIIFLKYFFRERVRASSVMTSRASSAWRPATAPSTFPSGTSPTSSRQVDAYHSVIFAKSMCLGINDRASQIFLVQNVIILLHKPITNPQPIVSRSNIM